MAGQEASIAGSVQEMLQDKPVSDETCTTVQSILGDLALRVVYYSALALAQIALELAIEPRRVSTL